MGLTWCRRSDRVQAGRENAARPKTRGYDTLWRLADRHVVVSAAGCVAGGDDQVDGRSRRRAGQQRGAVALVGEGQPGRQGPDCDRRAGRPVAVTATPLERRGWKSATAGLGDRRSARVPQVIVNDSVAVLPKTLVARGSRDRSRRRGVGTAAVPFFVSAKVIPTQRAVLRDRRGR